jgi:Zn-dependent peptidase ImmA (M78 family)
MNQMTPEQVAVQVLRDHWGNGIPVATISIAQAMGVRVFEKSDMAVSGELTLGPDGGYRIYLKDSDPAVRKRFTVAHELGHLCLGHELPRARKDNSGYSFYNFDPLESDANSFAAALLMPEVAVRHFVDVGLDFYALVKKFHVSEQTMQIRLERLGRVFPDGGCPLR